MSVILRTIRNGGNSIELSAEAAMLSSLLRDADLSGASKEIIDLDVEPAVLQAVGDFTEEYLKTLAPNWFGAVDLTNVCQFCDLFDVIQVANYLGIEPLMEATSATLAHHLRSGISSWHKSKARICFGDHVKAGGDSHHEVFVDHGSLDSGSELISATRGLVDHFLDLPDDLRIHVVTKHLTSKELVDLDNFIEQNDPDFQRCNSAEDPSSEVEPKQEAATTTTVEVNKYQSWLSLLRSGGCCIDRAKASPGALQWLGARRVAVRHISCTYDTGPGDIVAFAEGGCRALESINMNECVTITNAAIDLLVRKCTGLDSISLHHGLSFNPSRRLTCTDVAIKSIATHCSELTSIHIGGFMVKMKDPSLIALSTGCAQLQSIGLYWIPGITDDGIIALLSGCPLLSRVELRHCCHITDVSIEAIASQCPNLKEITLESSYFTNRALAALARCQHLHAANVGRCDLVTDAGVIALVRGCTELTQLNLTKLRIKDVTVEAMIAHCPTLTHVDLSYCPRITHTTIAALSRCRGLKEIHLDGPGGANDISLKALAESCPLLSVVSLLFSMGFTDAAVVALARGCPNLRDVDFSGAQLTDASMEALGANCPALTCITLHACKDITDVGVSQLSRGCPSLINVTISDIDGISDVGVAALCSCCPGLTSLDIFGCFRVTDLALMALSRHCHRLNRLRLPTGLLPSQDVIDALWTGCPRLDTDMMIDGGNACADICDEDEDEDGEHDDFDDDGYFEEDFDEEDDNDYDNDYDDDDGDYDENGDEGGDGIEY